MKRAALALLFAAGCVDYDTLDEWECPPEGTTYTYEGWGENYMAAYCQGCHGAPVGERHGAPEGYDFGSREAIVTHIDRIFVRAAAGNTTMPPGPDDPPEEYRYQLAEWLACGAPP